MFNKIRRELAYHWGCIHAPFPESVTLELNYHCVLRCKMCNMWKKDFRKSRIGNNKILSKLEIERIIDELSRIGVHNIYFCGGEPFLRKDFLDITKFCMSKGLTCSTISNGYLINKDLAKKIVDSGIGTLGISLDGANSELHDTLRGVQGAFDRAIQAIRSIRKCQKENSSEMPEVFINCTISSKNLMDLPNVVDLAKSLSIRRINFNYLSVVDAQTITKSNDMVGETIIAGHTFAEIDRSLLLQKEQVDQLNVISQLIKERAGSDVQCDWDPALLKGDRLSLQQGSFPVLKCSIPWRAAMITPTGDIVPCAMFTGFKMGNLREKAFSEIWNSEKALKIRRIVRNGPLPPICQKCCMVHESTANIWKRIYDKLSG